MNLMKFVIYWRILKMNKPKVSIILSSYNHADFIGESIESILSQTFSDFELIIVDDHSSDNSWEVIKRYKDPRIITIRNEKNLGVVVRPEIIDMLRGEYFAMAHCDDKWDKTKLEKQVKFLDKNLEYAACFTLVKPINEDGNDFDDESHRYFGVFEQKNRTRLEWLRQFFYDGNVLCHPSMMMRVDAQKKYNLYAYGCAALPDEYRWIKLCLHDNIYVLQEKLTLFRVRKNEMNTSGDRLDNILRLNFERLALLDCYLETLSYKEEDFVKIFPTARKFLNKTGKNNFKYVFGRILIDMKDIRPCRIYGLKLVWDMLQNPKEREEIEKLYGFSHKDFIELSGSIDIFGVQDTTNTLTTIVHYDTGDGFKPELAISKNVYVNSSHRFYVEYDLSKIKNICRLRFDPAHGVYCILKNLEILVDGKKVEYEPIDATINDGSVIFNVSNPNIIIPEGASVKLSVSGEFWKRDYSEIDALIKNPPRRRFLRH